MLVMGILNVTPDSFSDGGLWTSVDEAVKHGYDMLAQGAQILDIGGESTRPGATQLTVDEEWARIEPVLTGLKGLTQISVDTYHAVTAQRAAELVNTGTSKQTSNRTSTSASGLIINDVTGGKGDPAMFATVADLGVDYIMQHSRGGAASTDDLAHYERPVSVEVHDELLRSRDRAVAAGINPEHIILDPGIGFEKTGDQDWDALAGIDMILSEGHRVLVGASRKRFLANVSTVGGEVAPSKAEDRDLATAIITEKLAATDVWAVRVHNVAASMTALRVNDTWSAARARLAAWQASGS